ncbi:hypothetical protein IscW_ISCW013509, partial [Ixodes scapularis]
LQLPYARLILPPLDTSRFDGTAWQPQLAPDNHKLQKPLPGTSSEGPGTDMSQASRLRQIFIQVLVIAWTIHTKPYQRADNLPLPIGASASLQLPYARLILPPLDTSRFDGTAWQPQLAPDNHKLQKPLPGTSSEGPGTD